MIGPQLVKATADAIAILSGHIYRCHWSKFGWIVDFLLFKATDPTIGPQAQQKGRSRREILKDPKIVVAMICAMVSYSLMNLVMTSTPLAVVGCGYSKNMAADIVSAHVLAMYIPLFFHWSFDRAFWNTTDYFLWTASAAHVVCRRVERRHFQPLFCQSHPSWVRMEFWLCRRDHNACPIPQPAERGTVQGMNDLMVFGSVTLASFGSGGLMNCSGSSAESGWAFVNFAMLPLLALAALALLWFRRSEKAQTPQAPHESDASLPLLKMPSAKNETNLHIDVRL